MTEVGQEQPKAKGGISRRNLIKGGLVAGAALVSGMTGGTIIGEKATVEKTRRTGELGVSWEKERGEILQFPAIIGMVYEETRFEGERFTGIHRDTKPIADCEMGLVKLEKRGGPGQRVTTTKTNSEGLYIFAGIGPGLYEVRPEAVETSESKGYMVQRTVEEIEITPQTKIVLGPLFGKIV